MGAQSPEAPTIYPQATKISNREPGGVPKTWFSGWILVNKQQNCDRSKGRLRFREVWIKFRGSGRGCELKIHICACISTLYTAAGVTGNLKLPWCLSVMVGHNMHYRVRFFPIRHFRSKKRAGAGAGAEMDPAIVSGIIMGGTPLYWPIFSLSPVTVPVVFNSSQFPSCV